MTPECPHCLWQPAAHHQEPHWHVCGAIRQVKPYGEHVLVVVLPRKQTTDAGVIVLHDEVSGRDDQAIVLRVGPRALSPDLTPLVTRVRFDPYSIKMVIDVDGAHTTNSAHAKVGAQALIHVDSIYGVVE